MSLQKLFLKEGDLVITPDGEGEIFEISQQLGFCSVFLSGDDPLATHPDLAIRRQSKRYARIYDLEKIHIKDFS